MALIRAILVEIKIIKILCERSLREGDRYALSHGTAVSEAVQLKLQPRNFPSNITTHNVPILLLLLYAIMTRRGGGGDAV